MLLTGATTKIQEKMRTKSFEKLTLLILILALPASSVNSYNQPRPNYSSAQEDLNKHDWLSGNDNFDINFEAHSQCGMGCKCWANSKAPQRILVVDCTGANKETIPQVTSLLHYREKAI